MTNKYLKELLIQNFQSHKDTKLTFDPRVNMITGDNSCGKSSIIRAIRFLAYNKPIQEVDTNLLRKGKTSIVIKATMSDDSWVIREKGKDVNRYIIYDDIIAKEHGGPLELNSFGTSVPEEVGRILGISPVVLSKSNDVEINIASQHDPAFMISHSSPEIARWVYSLTHMDDLRYAIDDLNKDHRKGNEKIKDYDNRIKSLNQELENFSDIEQREKKINLLSEDNENIEIDIDQLEELSTIYRNAQDLKSKIIPTKNRISFLEDNLSYLSKDFINKIEDNIRDLDFLVSSQNELNDLNDKIEKNKKKIEKLSPVINIDEENLVEQIKELKELIDVFNSINNIQLKINKSEKESNEIEQKTNKMMKDLEDIQKDIFGDNSTTCPVCGSDIDDSLIDHIIEEMDHGKN